LDFQGLTPFLEVEMVSFDDVRAAADLLDGVAHQTPVAISRLLNQACDNQVFLKCENLQRAGAFKFRGAYNTIFRLPNQEKACGVATYSSGNHAQALARVCQMLNIQATIVMPQNAPSMKLEATRDYGADIVTYDPATGSREQIARALAEKHGYTIIPPFNHPGIIAGQGTAALELIQAVGEMDYLFVPCGGGGLLSGSAIAAKSLSPSCRVIGVEPIAGDDATRSFHEGTLQTVHNPDTIADGARTPSLGDLTFPIIREYVDDMLTVSDDDLIRTMFFLWTRLKLIVEPTGVLGLAAVYNRRYPLENKRIGVILSGGNVDLVQAGEWFKQLDQSSHQVP
jgi:threonine dehydratase